VSAGRRVPNLPERAYAPNVWTSTPHISSSSPSSALKSSSGTSCRRSDICSSCSRISGIHLTKTNSHCGTSWRETRARHRSPPSEAPVVGAHCREGSGERPARGKETTCQRSGSRRKIAEGSGAPSAPRRRPSWFMISRRSSPGAPCCTARSRRRRTLRAAAADRLASTDLLRRAAETVSATTGLSQGHRREGSTPLLTRTFHTYRPGHTSCACVGGCNGERRVDWRSRA
jgi:hypothetical protein